MKKAILVLLVLLASGCVQQTTQEQPKQPDAGGLPEIEKLNAGEQTGEPAPEAPTVNEEKQPEKLTLTSPAFEEGEAIPPKYTCDGDDASPPLEIRGTPPKSESLVLIVDDPDAPKSAWVHWVVWNIPPKTGVIEEDSIPENTSLGLNDFRKHEYGGPCPPSGTHRYVFRLYALDAKLELDPSSTRGDVDGAMAGHILSQTSLTGAYQRKQLGA